MPRADASGPGDRRATAGAGYPGSAGSAGSAGYSGTPLPAKLGVKPGMRVVLLGAPAGFEEVFAGARVVRRSASPADLCVVFVRRRADLERRWAALTRSMTPSGAVWVAWPKKASGVPTDMTEDVVRQVVLPTGWVDVKVCAIDDTWSGLKCVLRLALRP